MTPSLVRRGLTYPRSRRPLPQLTPKGRLRQPESAFQNKVLELARLFRWRVHHMHDSRKQEWGTDSGFPDLVLCKPPRLLFVELKAADGRLTKEQSDWLCDVRSCGVEAYIWRPADFVEIGHVLGTRSGRAFPGEAGLARPNEHLEGMG